MIEFCMFTLGNFGSCHSGSLGLFRVGKRQCSKTPQPDPDSAQARLSGHDV